MNLENLLKISKNLTVLYIEDDHSREVTTDLFSKIFNLVMVAIDGKDGLDKYIKYYEETNQYFDLIISDINMPKMNGLELSKNILTINNKLKSEDKS